MLKLSGNNLHCSGGATSRITFITGNPVEIVAQGAATQDALFAELFPALYKEKESSAAYQEALTNYKSYTGTVLAQLEAFQFSQALAEFSEHPDYPTLIMAAQRLWETTLILRFRCLFYQRFDVLKDPETSSKLQ